jgi:hypothetical protein
MRKPNLFIVGAPKCGTTAWVSYLSTHPDIFFSPLKEPHYFCTYFPRWGRHNDEGWYLSLFEGAGAARAVGEASVRYLHSREAARNIRRFNPDAKIIVFVRDQADYLPSQHNQMVFNKDECIEDFETAWRLSGKRDATNIAPTCREPSFLDYATAGAFSQHVERYFEQFAEDQIRVFHFRDWSRDPRSTYLEIMRFLGVEDDGRSDFPPVNRAHRRRTRWLWKVQRSPSLLKAAGAVKSVLGVRSSGLGLLLKRIDTERGSVAHVSDALKREIAAYYEADNARLERRIWRPPDR